MDTLENSWKTYKSLISEDAGPVQLRETEYAFYAGATAMFGLVTSVADECSEEDGEKRLNGYHDEIQAFAKQVVQRAKCD